MPRFFVLIFLGLLCLSAHEVAAQNLQNKANEIRAAMDARDFDRAEALVREFRAGNEQVFLANNYDYLLGRLSERRGATAEAQAHYLAVLNRRSVLAPYALWHLSTLARTANDFALERQQLSRLMAAYPSS